MPPPLPEYLLDACAVLAYLNREDGWRVIRDLFDRARRGEARLSISAVNQAEVYYDRLRKSGLARTIEVFEVVDALPITVIQTIDLAVVHEAARFKVPGKMSLADAFLVATALHTGATVVTADWDELDPVAAQGGIPFLWIRPRPVKPRP